MILFIEIEKPILKLIWNVKGPWIDKTILTKNKLEGLTMISNLLQSYGDQNSVVLSSRQTYKPLRQNRKPRNKTSHNMVN